MEPGEDQRDERIPQHLADTLSELSDLLLAEQDLDSILDLVVSRAPGAIGGADAASITLLKTPSFETRHATSDDAREVDAVQYASGLGPCIAAAQENARHNVSLAETTPRLLPLEPRKPGPPPGFARISKRSGSRSAPTTS